MISLHHHFAALVLLGGLLPAVADQSLDALKPQPTLRRGATRAFPASRQAAQQLLATVDAGDVYASAYGPKKLLRLADAIAVSADGDAGEFHRQLAAPGKALEGFVTTGTRAQGIAVLKSPREERQKYLIDPSTLRQLLQSVRSTTSGRSANPVFIDPSTGLRLLATSEIIIRLKPGIDGPNYFGADWARVKPLWGTTDQFVQTLPGATAEEILEAVSRHAAGAGVEWAEPNFIMQVAKSFTPDDALFIDQWHLQNAGQFGGKTGADAGLTGAWDITLGRSNVVVAILDDGVQLNHPDLAANIFINAGEIPGNGLDDDGNGFVDDVHGWDFFANDNDPNPANSLDNHGTSLAGVIAAVGNNGIGVSGVAPGCRILPLKMLTGEDGIPVSEVSRVLHYAAGLNLQGRSVWRGADIINISLTFAKSAVVDAALTAAATKGRNGKGCAIFCAAGNSAGAWVPFEVDFPVAGTYTLRWAFSKDPNDIFEVGADTVWIDNVIFPDGTVESFEQGGLPPGWITGGASPWINVVDGVGGNHALTGWNGPGSHSLRAGHLADSQTNYVEVTADIDAGTLRFWAWTESEAGNVAGEFQGFDIFQFIVDGNEIDYDFGVPVLETAVAYPASHPSTFGVGASTDFDFRADYSQFGATLDFVAPSDGGNANITTTDRTGADGYNGGASPDGDYAYDFGGTSAATPIASGIAALVLSTNPYLTLAELRTLLRSTCDHIGDVFYDDTGFNAFYGYGRLNAETAVKRARPNIIVSITAAPSPVVVGDSLTYSISVRNSGPSISGPVSITNELPAGVVTGAITPAPSQRIGRQLIFHATNMPSGSLLSYRIVVTNLTVGTNVDIVSVGTDIPESTVADNSATHVVTVLPLPLLSIGNATVLETDSGATNALFMVSLSNPSTRVVTVRYAAVSGAATRGRDFAAASGLLRFTPGETVKTINVRVLPDRLDEDDENFFVNLSAPVNAVISEAQGIGRILDNDPLPTVSVNDVRRTEGNSGGAPVVFSVRLSAPSGRPVSVHFATASGSAQDTVDFIGTNGTLVFAPGKTLLTVPVRILGDTVPETNEVFFLKLSNPIAATLGDAQGSCTIVNNDPVPRIYISDATVIEGDAGTTNALFNVWLSGPSGATVQVRYAATNASAGVADFSATNGLLTFVPGETNQVIAVPVHGDTLSESNEIFIVHLSFPTNAAIGDATGIGTIVDDDPLPALSISDVTVAQLGNATTNAVFHVHLSTPSGKTVTVRFATSNGTAVAGADYAARTGLLAFSPGTTNQDIPIVVSRATAGETNQHFFANLAVPVNATLSDAQAVGNILSDSPVARLAPAVTAQILQIRFAGGTAQLWFQSKPGLRYVVEHREDWAEAGGWKPLEGLDSLIGTGGALEVLDRRGAGASRGFYRVRLAP